MNTSETTTDNDHQTDAQKVREPYTPPTIEMFPPMHDVTFGTNVNPLSATVVIT